ncbi:hypothetical protein SK128_018089 [Halocaridina rubra]|uniref:NACHT domain-containing protein n=1 Tax=Halocaridina rubra TaxID=373956 RepID=A0AAN8XKZ2_HALRR
MSCKQREDSVTEPSQQKDSMSLKQDIPEMDEASAYHSCSELLDAGTQGTVSNHDLESRKTPTNWEELDEDTASDTTTVPEDNCARRKLSPEGQITPMNYPSTGSNDVLSSAARSNTGLPNMTSPPSQVEPQRKTEVFKAENVYRLRLQTMIGSIGENAMRRVFQEGIKSKPKEKSLFDFYKESGINVVKFKDILNKSQRNRITKDSEGNTYDITLLFICIQWGSKITRVATNENPRWRGDLDCLESCLTNLKNLRNKLYHNETLLDKKMFIEETEMLRKLLENMLMHAKKLYNISSKEVDDLINIGNEKINLFRQESMLPSNWSDYQKDNLFLEMLEYAQINGLIILSKLYDSWVYFTPINLICYFKVKVSDVYTEMILKKETRGGDHDVVHVEYDNLLDDIKHSKDDPVILIEGFAGVGKTTLTKKIMSDWISQNSSMTHLTAYDFLLYAVCRNNRIRTFDELLVSLLPELAKSFQEKHFSEVILCGKVLLIVDGLDEFNESSVNLFKEVLELKKTSGITILATTRPERVETYYNLAESRQISTKHIQLTGIPAEKREDFVLKYFKEIQLRTEVELDVTELLEYLKKTARRLSDLWCLPYNLTLLIVLWVYKSEVINYIVTAPELYWEIHLLMLDKLMLRMRNNEMLSHLPDSAMKEKVSNFEYTLCHESLIALVKDEINISEESFGRLEEACRLENLPVEEMIGAFLKTVVIITPQGRNCLHSFAHKGVQEFLGALYIYKHTKSEIPKQLAAKFLKDLKDLLVTHNIPGEKGQEILRLVNDSLGDGSTPEVPQDQKKRVKPILENLHVNASLDIKKYQNLFVTTIGLFHLESVKIKDSIKLEVLELLKETGIDNINRWMMILDSVKCDTFVASFISQQKAQTSRTELSVTDSNLFSHISLLRAMADLTQHGIQYVSVDIEDEVYGINDLLIEISKKNLIVQELRFLPDLVCPTRKIMSADAVNSVFQRGGVVIYKGAYTHDLALPDSLDSLHVSIADRASYEYLCTYLMSYQGKPRLCLSPDLDVSGFAPLPNTKIRPNLYIPGVNKENYLKAVDVARAVLSTEGRYYRLFFPGSTLEVNEIYDLIREMKLREVKVEWGIIFPDNEISGKRGEQGERQELLKFAKKEIGRNIRWYDDSWMWKSG